MKVCKKNKEELAIIEGIKEVGNFAVGEAFEIYVKKERLYSWQKHYWDILAALSYHKGMSKDYWHFYFKCMFLPVIPTRMPNGAVVYYPNSTSYDRMNQQEFEAYTRNVESYVVERLEVSIEELLRTYHER